MESALLGSEDQWISRLPEKPCKINKFRGAQCFRYVGDQVGGVSASPADGPGALGSKRCDSNQGWACRAMCGWRHGGRCAFSAVHAFVSWTDCPSHPTPCRIQGIVFDLLLIGGRICFFLESSRSGELFGGWLGGWGQSSPLSPPKNKNQGFIHHQYYLQSFNYTLWYYYPY